MTLRQQVSFWLIALVGFVIFLFVFRTVLLPFVAGMALAYLLDPLADWLEKVGLSRMWATLAILLIFLIVFVLAFVMILPILGHQLSEFASRLPGYISALQGLMTEKVSDQLHKVAGIGPDELKSTVTDLLGQSASWLTGLLKSAWSGGQALLSILSLAVVTPVVAFYLLYDWDRMIARVDSWLPRDHVETIRRLGREMDEAVAGFVRGQLSVCLLLGAFYGIALSIAGLQFGLLIGMGAGLISFIPYVGASVGLVLAVGVALVQFWPDWVSIVIVAAIFGVGQFLEGNILHPKLVGNSVGLHPVVLMFSLFAFGALFGFVGLMIAVPASAMIAVLVRFALQQYLDSPVYYGTKKEVPKGTES